MYGGNRITVALFCLNSPPFNLHPSLHFYFFILNFPRPSTPSFLLFHFSFFRRAPCRKRLRVGLSALTRLRLVSAPIPHASPRLNVYT